LSFYDIRIILRTHDHLIYEIWGGNLLGHVDWDLIAKLIVCDPEILIELPENLNIDCDSNKFESLISNKTLEGRAIDRESIHRD